MELSEVDLVLVQEETHRGPVQMALEEIAADRIAAGGAGLVRVFRWEPSTLSMGYGQDPETVDWDYCANAGIEVTRRQTGGGGIYHDNCGDISYSIIVPKAAVSGDLLTAYHTLCEPILEFFDVIGIDAAYAEREHPSVYEPACFLRDIHPAHDILVDGRKICGNAQYRQRDAIIQHGSILFDLATTDHLGVFNNPGVDRDRFESRTATITELVDISRAEAVEALTNCLAEWSNATQGTWAETEITAAHDLATAKYASDGWVLGEATRTRSD